ncbi:SDR family oxidoreductase [Ectobacillus ponti]|uniref:SDR family oxidoreductase n=1 Tax=Ectobacillus ponti TaxID=2961894 RepID=A0AA41X2M3_9BACI|nr:SDR family oxidoreductase [Ectobacillus ponti]
MKVLILGGTRFLGKHLAKEALERGYEVTLFNRGNHPAPFAGVEQLLGDRDGSLEALRGRQWDAVIDTCGFVPRVITKIAEVLGGNIGHYTYISSISVYKDWIPYDIDESYELVTMTDEEAEEATKDNAGPIYEHYGALKALCEHEAEKRMPGKVLTVRAGQIVGPEDYTDRLSYWLQRVHKGGRVLCPGNPDRPVQIVDVRDLAAWILNMAEQRRAGTYNVTSPAEACTMGQLLQTCKEASASDAEFIWAQEAFLMQQEVAPWIDMPLWLPETEILPGETAPWKGAFSMNVEQAVAAGLSFRPLTETIRDTLAWQLRRPAGQRKAGISLQREAELLARWQSVKLH